MAFGVNSGVLAGAADADADTLTPLSTTPATAATAANLSVLITEAACRRNSEHGIPRKSFYRIVTTRRATTRTPSRTALHSLATRPSPTPPNGGNTPGHRITAHPSPRRTETRPPPTPRARQPLPRYPVQHCRGTPYKKCRPPLIASKPGDPRAHESPIHSASTHSGLWTTPHTAENCHPGTVAWKSGDPWPHESPIRSGSSWRNRMWRGISTPSFDAAEFAPSPRRLHEWDFRSHSSN